jgi:CoA:oxalate CoA-transferase
MILADLGAEVVKVEQPDVGDDARQFGPFLPSGISGYFSSINRGKKSIALNLKEAADKQTFLQLAKQADIIVENFRPGTMDSLGIGFESLKELKPDLICVSLSGFGHSGTQQGRPAYDIVVQALSGLMSITGEPQGGFVRVGTSISDLLTGLYGVIAVLSALQHRNQSGAGTVCDLAMLDCTVSALENALCRFAVTGQNPAPLGTRHPSITPFQAFPTADASIVIAAGNQTLWRKLCEILKAPQLIDDPKLSTNDLRTENIEYLDECLIPILKTQPQAYWLSEMESVGIPSAAIRTVDQVVADDHLQDRQMLHEMDDGSGGSFVTAGSPLRMNSASPKLSTHAPQLGEHTAEILESWLGDESNG